jgi:hypothetical protein
MSEVLKQQRDILTKDPPRYALLEAFKMITSDFLRLQVHAQYETEAQK